MDDFGTLLDMADRYQKDLHERQECARCGEEIHLHPFSFRSDDDQRSFCGDCFLVVKKVEGKE